MALRLQLPLDVWQVIVEQCVSPIAVSRIAATSRALWKRFHKHPVILRWKGFSPEQGLYEASLGGHGYMVNLFIAKGANYWNHALGAASLGGHRDLVDMLIAKGANNWIGGLYGASCGGHGELVRLFISKGADNWDNALFWASKGGHQDLVDFFLSKGAVMP
jgi:hypothetical protein